MLSRKKSFLLNTLIISFLMSGSHTTLGKVSDKWEKMASQPTESQKAADAARAEREKELQAIRDSKKEPASEEKTPVEPMKKPTETTQPTPTKPHVTHTPPATPSPVQKRRTLQEQIALNKQKKAEDLHKLQEMNKGKAAAHHSAKPTTNLEKELAMSPTQKKLMANLEKETVAEPMKKSLNPPPPPKGGPKSVHMSPTQKKMMEKMDQEDNKKPTETTHPAVNLAHPPLKMHTEEHEETTLPMPKKGGSKSVHMSPTQKKMMEKMDQEDNKKPTKTTHPAVNLAHPPLKMHTEEHEETTLPMPSSKAVAQQADTKVEPAKANSGKDDLLAQIRKGTALKSTKQTSQPAEWESNSGHHVRAGELVMDLKRSKNGVQPSHEEMVQHLVDNMAVTAPQAEKILEELGL